MRELLSEWVGHVCLSSPQNLLASIELGLTSFGADVGTLSFDFLVVLGSYIHKNCGPELPVRQGLRPFLKVRILFSMTYLLCTGDLKLIELVRFSMKFILL